MGNTEAAEMIADGVGAPAVPEMEGGAEKPTVESSKVEKASAEGEAV